MVVVSSIREPGGTGLRDDSMVQELMPTRPFGTENTVGVSAKAVVDAEFDGVEVAVVTFSSPTTNENIELAEKL
jgi:hypothetical protein